METLVDWVPIGPRFSNNILQGLKVALKIKPPQGRRLLLMTTTSAYSVLEQMDILSCFDNEIAITKRTNVDECNKVMIEAKFEQDQDRVRVINQLTQYAPRINISIKKALTNIETARHDDDPVSEIVELMNQAV